MVASHTIFHRPFPVQLDYEELDTPPHYRRWPGGADLPDKLRVWRVHGELKQKDYGLVSDGYGFEDSPDCEFISGGHNSKGPESVALGRQANFFLWGFCAPPSEMTESARTVFLNTIAYMKQFDGQRPLVHQERSARRWALMYVDYFRKKEVADYARKKFPADLLASCGDDPDRLDALLKANMDYLWNDGETFHVDADCQALGVANRDPALLEKCAAMLDASTDEERAHRLLKRYVGRDFDSAEELRRWLGQAGDRLFFSDQGGYRFFVAPSESVGPATDGSRQAADRGPGGDR